MLWKASEWPTNDFSRKIFAWVKQILFSVVKLDTEMFTEKKLTAFFKAVFTQRGGMQFSSSALLRGEKCDKAIWKQKQPLIY